MALVIEDGTGNAAADSYVDATTADAYWLKRNNTAWAALTTAAKEAALIGATAFVDNQHLHPFRGTRKTASQALQWPRTGAVERNGPAIGDSEIPVLVTRAVLAVSHLAATTDLQPVLARGGRVTSEAVGSISRSYAPDAPGHDIILAASGLLAPLIRGKDTVGAWAPPDSIADEPFRVQPGMFDHP